MQFRIDDIDLRIGNGPADADLGVAGLDFLCGRINRRLGWAVKVPQGIAALRGAAGPGRATSPRRRTASLSPGVPLQPDCSNKRQVAGVPCKTVTPLIQRGDELGAVARRLPAGDHYLRADDKRQEKLQAGDVERQGGDGEKHIVLRSVPGWALIDQRRFTTPRCSTCTPFGLPVDPEV